MKFTAEEEAEARALVDVFSHALPKQVSHKAVLAAANVMAGIAAHESGISLKDHLRAAKLGYLSGAERKP